MRKTLSSGSVLPLLCCLGTVFLCFPVSIRAQESLNTVAAVTPSPAAPLPATVPVIEKKGLPEAPSHKFFDRENLMLHGMNFAMQTADLVSTRLVLNRGGREEDPLARPFVNNGLGTQIVASYAIGTGGTLLGSYWLHRTGHHRLERWLPLTVSAAEALAAASNFHLLAGGNIVPKPAAPTRPAALRILVGSH